MRRLRIACLALGLLAPAAALATVTGSPVQFRVVGPIAREGRHVRATLEARALAGGLLDVTGLQAGRGAVRRLERPAAAHLAPGDVRTFEFEGEADDRTTAFTLDYLFDREPRRWTFDLRAWDDDGVARPALGVLVMPGGAGPGLPATPVTAGLPRREPPPAGAQPAAPVAVPGERDITVHGRITYQRPELHPGGTVPAATVGAEGVTIKIYDNDGLWNTYLTKTETDANGNFSKTFHWTPLNALDPDADIVLECNFGNGWFQIRNPAGLVPYTFWTGTWRNVGGDVDVGTWTGTESQQGALGILNNLAKGRNWYASREGFAVPFVNVFWPEPTGLPTTNGGDAWYDRLLTAIHIGEGRTWSSATHLHEYGHHFVNRYATWSSPDYCNGICDAASPVPLPWSCGHCVWCAETDHDAFNEGWPDWIGHVQSVDCGLPGSEDRSAETVLACSDPAFIDPLRTEGNLQALLQDLWDSADPSESDYQSNWAYHDVLGLGAHPIFQVLTNDRPTTPQQFINAFAARFPSYRTAFYELQRLNRFPATDNTAPSTVTISSDTHTLEVPSTNHDLHVLWTPSTDDLAGLAYYRVTITNQSSQTLLNRKVSRDTTDIWFHAPSGYAYLHVTVQAVDRDGNLSLSTPGGGYSLMSPNTIDLTGNLPAGWADSTVVRGAADAGASSVPLPATQITGGSNSTYWNFAVRNLGSVATADSVTCGLHVDGVRVATRKVGSVPGSGLRQLINAGPFTVSAGRHTITTTLDDPGAVAETNEDNNRNGRQWAWSPATLNPAAYYSTTAPAPATAWSGAHGALYYNCFGFRIASPGASDWNLAYAFATNVSQDVDVRIHNASSSPDSAFGAHRGYSSRPAGRLDAVIANRNTAPATTWDVGIVNTTGATGTVWLKHVPSGAFTFGDSLAVTLGQSDYAVLRSLAVSAGNAGPVTVTVRHDPKLGPLHVAWFDASFTTGSLLDAAATTATDTTTGIARLDVASAAAGSHGVVVWRDPSESSGSVPFTLQVARTLPQLKPYAFAGWHSAFVPRPRRDGTPSSVPLPDTLWGDSTATWLNVGMVNASPAGGGAFKCEYALDGVPTWSLNVLSFGGWAASALNDATAYPVRGGRHTLGMTLDVPDAIKESDEGDNGFAEQYVWQPRTVPLESLFTRGAPPDRVGGWTSLADSIRWFNCDGWRTPTFAPSGNDGWWAGAAVIPVGDVDLRVHEVVTGTKAGFAASLATSGWGTYQSDFALVNFNRTTSRRFDVGVLGTPTGALTYYGRVTTSVFLAASPNTTFGPFTFDENAILRLHEAYLHAGTHYTATLLHDAGAVDWGLSVHGPSAAAYAKSEALDAAWVQPAGTGESFTFPAPSTGYYCFAVWRVALGGGAGTYRLDVRPAVTGVDDPAPPALTALAAPRPNPFTSTTEIAFTLARAGDVSLAVYDVAGHRVRLLESGPRVPGEHRLRWDGRDAEGRPAAPGVYLVRLEAPGGSATAKLVRLK